MESGRVVTFGEIMLRLSPPGHGRLTDASRFEACFGGAEANVAVSLARFGVESAFVSRLPENDLGESALRALRGRGVHTEHIRRGDGRLGIYFLEAGHGPRSSTVLYDRAGSSFSLLDPEDFDWNAILEDACRLHISGITPALGRAAADTALEAVAVARERAVTVSLDLNYRKKLWPRARAERVLGEIAGKCDLLFANEEDAAAVFGIEARGTDVEGGRLDPDGYEPVARQLVSLFPTIRHVAITLRESYSASRNGWSALLWDGGRMIHSRRYDIDVVDRVGAGDAFAAGLIYGMVRKKESQYTLDFATAASCLKQTIPGDFNDATVEEIEALVTGAGSGRVKR